MAIDIHGGLTERSSEMRKTEKIWLLGEMITLKVTGEETEDKYSVCEIEVPSQSGPPSHYHTNLEEGFYVLEGEFSFQHNERTINANAGSFTHIHKEVVHKYKNIGKSTGRLLVTGVPAGLESFFEEAGILITDEKSFTPASTPPDIARIVDISRKHGIFYVPTLK
jgi:quercetin dioxygenase-like cupin family protein